MPKSFDVTFKVKVEAKDCAHAKKLATHYITSGGDPIPQRMFKFVKCSVRTKHSLK